MQDELLAALGGLAQLLVEPVLLPARQDLGLFLRQAGPHREIRLRQEQGLGIIALGLRHVFQGFLGGYVAGRFRGGKAQNGANSWDQTLPNAGKAAPARLSVSRAWAASAAI